MRLNFQQQRAINPSAGPNLFVPESGQAIENEQKLRLQLIKQQQDAINDMAQAAVVIAKANQQAKDADFKADFADLRVKLNAVGNQISDGYESNQEFKISHLSLETDENGKPNKKYTFVMPTNKAGHFGYSQVDSNKEQVAAWLEKTVLQDFGDADDKYIRAVKREVNFTIENAFSSAKKSSLRHTKNHLTAKVNEENELVAGEISRSKDLKYISQIVGKRYQDIKRDLEGTFSPVDIASKQSKFLENSVTELAYRLTGADSSPEDKQMYQTMYKEAMKGDGLFQNVDPLFLQRLHRDAGSRVFNLERSDEIAAAKYALQYDAENFFVVGGVEIVPKEVDGTIKMSWKKRQIKNADGNLIDDPNWSSSYKSLFPKLTDNDITTLLNQGIKEIEKEANDKFKTTVFDGTARSDFNVLLRDYISYWQEAWITDSNGLRKTNSLPPSPPWLNTKFKGEEWEKYRNNLLKLDSVYRGADAAYMLAKNPDSSAEDIQQVLDDLKIKAESIPTFSEGIRKSALDFLNSVSPYFQKQIKRINNVLNTGENNVNRICESKGIDPSDEACLVEGIKMHMQMNK